jgi:non-specific serine/threonine protein kinase
VIKSKSAKRTNFINQELAPRAEFRRILSGLPTPKSPLDLYAQFEFLDPAIIGERNYWNFLHKYAITQRTNFGGTRPMTTIVVGYRNEDQLRKLIEPYSYRIEFRPEIPSTYSFREVTLTDEQRRIYDEMKKYATAKIEGSAHVTATIVIVQMLRLHQILMGHVVDEAGEVHDVKERRTDTLLDILADYNGKAIIWASYDRSIRRIAAAIAADYGEEAVACFWGGNATTREDDERRFKTDPRCRFMIATPDSGGRGRTWDGANLVVYYSSKNNLEHREQSEQRAQNVGKAAGVDYIDLVAPNTVDGVIIKALREKIDMASAITGDNFREWLI